MFNIFNKNLQDITYEDIKNLIDNKVHEGWTLEYKQQFPKSKKIAKSISSFANSNGGYYIIGIKESDDNKNLPNEIWGMSYKEFSNPYERIDNAVKEYISPIPYYEIEVIDIPNTARYVAVVMIPEGNNPPYLHNGSIYQRVGEVTNPIPIKDRYILDQLFKKSEHYNKNMLNFFNNEISIMNNKNNPILELYFFNVKNHFITNFFHEKTFNLLKQVFDEEVNLLPDNDEGNIPGNFNVNFNQSYKSYIIKNTVDNCDIFCEIFQSGNCKIILDIPFTTLKLLNETECNVLQSYLKNTRNFDLNSLENFKFIDICSFYFIISVLINKYFKFIDSLDNYTYNFVFNFKLLNCEESTLKFEFTKDCKEYYDKFGIPICYKNYIKSDILSLNETLLKTDGDKSTYPLAIYNDILMSLSLITPAAKDLLVTQISNLFGNNKE